MRQLYQPAQSLWTILLLLALLHHTQAVYNYTNCFTIGVRDANQTTKITLPLGETCQFTVISPLDATNLLSSNTSKVRVQANFDREPLQGVVTECPPFSDCRSPKNVISNTLYSYYTVNNTYYMATFMFSNMDANSITFSVYIDYTVSPTSMITIGSVLSHMIHISTLLVAATIFLLM